MAIWFLTESRKKKAKNWEDNDFYGSDDDEFLDRTGSIEQKRALRMKKAGKLEKPVETFESLVSTMLLGSLSFLGDSLVSTMWVRESELPRRVSGEYHVGEGVWAS